MAEREVVVALPMVSEDLGERTITPAAPPVSDLPRTFHDVAGYKLACGALIGLFVVMFGFLIILFMEPRAIPQKEAAQLLTECLKLDANKDICPPAKVELAKTVMSDPSVAAYREFWKTMFERIVGTTILPIVTALLGFLFGAQGRSVPTTEKK